VASASCKHLKEGKKKVKNALGESVFNWGNHRMLKRDVHKLCAIVLANRARVCGFSCYC
jgi:hypothetical protein